MAMITPEAKEGRWLVGIAIAVTLLGDALVIFLSIMRSGFAGSSFMRWFITAALLYAVWQGHRWARWLTVALLGAGLLLALPTALRTWHPLLVGLVIQFTLVIGLLAFPPSVSAFQSFQRLKGKSAPAP